MNRPLPLRMAPERLSAPLWWRFYRTKQNDWLPLYSSATLRYSPLVSMDLVPGDMLSDQIAFTGVYDLALTRRVVELARRGGTFIDVGANLGYFSLLWAGSSSHNKCVAFEPSPRNIDIFRRNVSQNRLETRIQLVPMAAGAAQEKVRFDVGPAEQTGWGGLSLEKSAGSIEVDVVRVDEVIQSSDHIALMKVDTEGADAWALMGCERLRKAGIVKEIWYEQNKRRMAALGIPLEAAQEYLRSVGYVSTAHGDPNAELVGWSAVNA